MIPDLQSIPICFRVNFEDRQTQTSSRPADRAGHYARRSGGYLFEVIQLDSPDPTRPVQCAERQAHAVGGDGPQLEGMALGLHSITVIFPGLACAENQPLKV